MVRKSPLGGSIRRLRNEQGITLVETLTTLVIFSMVVSILFTFLIMGISMYKRVSAETRLRSQGDVVFAQLSDVLRGAVYVQQGADNRELRYVKPASTPEEYVKEYVLRSYDRNDPEPDRRSLHGKLYIHEVDRSGNEHEAGVIEAGGGGRFWVDGEFIAEGNETIKLRLSVDRSGSDSITAIERTKLELENRIRLFRID
jgi:hypothetical protein